MSKIAQLTLNLSLIIVFVKLSYFRLADAIQVKSGISMPVLQRCILRKIQRIASSQMHVLHLNSEL